MPRLFCIVLLVWLTAICLWGEDPRAEAADRHWIRSVRAYQFLRTEEALQTQRRDTELWILRLALDIHAPPRIHVEAHGVLNLISPSIAGGDPLATAPARHYLPLQKEFIDRSGLELEGLLDRLNLQVNPEWARIVAGRQAISWGVNFFWPSMDLFSPFSPQQIDREYKAGVDAVRWIIPMGPYSELELIGAILGSSLTQDGAAGTLARIYLGFFDLGLMAGKFHGDTVGGAFITGDVRGTGARAEVTWTHSDDAFDQERGREQFFRVSAGLDRQLTPDLSLTIESAWNEFGEEDPSRYLALLNSDRVLRGEVNTAGQYYSGISLSWQAHPLWNIRQTFLINWLDPSSLSLSSFQWSTSDNSEVLFGFQAGLGEGLSAEDLPKSEYGSAPHTLYAAFKGYF